MKNLPTVKHLLNIALKPVGSTMYIYGGGWNKEDTGAGKSALIKGVPKEWKIFFEKQTSVYDFRKHLYEIENGLDCSGYIGWVLNNLFGEISHEGFVYPSYCLGEKLQEKGLGFVSDTQNIKEIQSGDIFYSEKQHHCYIVIGKCADSSLLICHSSPPGVMVSGITDNKNKSQSAKLAEKFMKENHYEWYKKYSQCSRGIDYLEEYSKFTFYKTVLRDPENIRQMDAENILKLFV